MTALVPQAAPRRRANEALVIEHFNASADTGSTYGVPTADDDGIPVPDSPEFEHVSLDLIKAAVSGDRDIRVMVYGYRRFRQYYSAGDLTLRGSSGYWVPIYDTDTISPGAADFNTSRLLKATVGFFRLAARIITNDGGTPALTAAFAFSGERR